MSSFLTVPDRIQKTHMPPTKSPPAARSSAATVRRRPASTQKDNAEDTSFARYFLIFLAIATLLVGLYIQLTINISESLKKSNWNFGLLSSPSSNAGVQYQETLVVADNLDAGYLDHIVDALLKFGHKLTFSPGAITPIKIRDELQQYPLIWTHDYPFATIKNLRPHQRLNHFPGTGFITNKLTLSTTQHVPHILKAFRMPADKDEFLEYARAHPERTQWIQKSSSHRGISIETLDTVNLDANETLVQEYMSNPLLVDGKKFDIGIYAVLTSVEPLRVYIYEAESLLRFCAHPYLDPKTQTFNSSHLDSYVVGDDYTPIWLMPSLVRHYIGANLGMKQTLNTYLKRLGKSGGDKIWIQIEETIKAVYKNKEHLLARMTRMYQAANNYNDTSIEGSLNQFFEMVRFDFIVDNNLNVYLMEANMSPNLSSRHFPPNRLLYEQVLQSYFSLVGLTQFARDNLDSSKFPVHYLDGRVELAPNSQIKSTLSTKPGHSSLSQGLTNLASSSSSSSTTTTTTSGSITKYGLNELISEKELSVYEELCVSDECHMNCQKVDCRVCYFCLEEPDKLHLRRAIFEQYSRWNFKRLLPSTRDEDLQIQLTHPDQRLASTTKTQVDSNYIHVQWFRGKCFSDPRFCSY